MAKVILPDLAVLQPSAIAAINANNTAIEIALENTLSRDGTSPNQMNANLDMNSFRILNLADASSDQEPITLAQLQSAILDGGDTLNLQIDKGTQTSGTTTFNAEFENQKLTVGGNITLAFTSWPATGNYAEVEIELVNGGAFTVTWPSINWLIGDGTKSTTFSAMNVSLQAAGTNWIIVWTTNGGSTLWGRAA